MRLIIFILFCLGIQTQDYSQVIFGSVTDLNGVSLQGVNILNLTTDFGVVSDSEGEFLIKAIPTDQLRFSFIGKETLIYSIKKVDTIFIEIKMVDKYSQLKTFEVSGKRINSVSVKYNDNILDYESIGYNTFLVLKRKLRQYQLTIEGVDTVYKVYPLTNLRPKSLFLDAFGNFHVVCKDSVRQVYLDTNLKFISTISLTDFRYQVRPIVYTDYSFLLKYQYSNNNKKYSLYKNNSTFYEVFDDETAKYAKDVLHASRSEQKSTSINNVKQLKINRDKMESSYFYRGVLSKKIKVNTFMNEENVIVFNLEFKKIVQLNLNNEFEKVVKIKKRYDKIIQDKERNFFYGYTLFRGLVSLDKLNIKSGEVISSFNLSKISFPKELKVIDGWVYYIKINKNNFNKLRRVAIN